VARALEGGLAAWRVFLHPSQSRLVRTDAKGAMKIGGGPGTGKTVVALHRARWLAETLASDARPVLVTTFSTPLARQLEPRLHELCADAPHLRQRIVVMGTTRLAQELLREAARPNRLLTELDEAWATALTHDGANRGRSFYECERVEVVARRGVRSEAEYLQAKRTGLHVRLTRPERAEVWRVLAAFEAALVAQGGGDDLALALAAAQAVDSGAAPRPYAAIVCDEAQDLGAGELRLLAALAREPSGASLRPNSLTLTGDAYQRLYRAPVPLMDCGIDVRGRSRILRINYRTTEAIRAAAVQLLKQGPVEPDEGDAGTLEGYRSLRRGSPPEERTFDSAEAEADWIASLAAPAKAGEPATSPLLVLARTNAELDELRRLLVARGRTPRVLGTNDLPDEREPLVLSTLHRAKGLESPRVVITGVGRRGRFPGGDARDRALWEASQEAALYVGYTRARDWCAVTRRG
jgi:superfamily I DNA/RNA helicase